MSLVLDSSSIDVTTWSPSVAELIGSGPYQFSNWVPGQYVVLERHPFWHFGIEHPPRNFCGFHPYYDIIERIYILASTIIIIELLILGYLLHRRSKRVSPKTDY